MSKPGAWLNVPMSGCSSRFETMLVAKKRARSASMSSMMDSFTVALTPFASMVIVPPIHVTVRLIWPFAYANVKPIASYTRTMIAT